MNFVFALRVSELLLFMTSGVLALLLVPGPFKWPAFVAVLGAAMLRQRRYISKFNLQ